MQTIPLNSIGIEKLTYRLGKNFHTLEDLKSQGLLTSDIGTLESFGFSGAYIAKKEESFDSLIATAKDVLTDKIRANLAGVLLYSGLQKSDGSNDLFQYDLQRLLYELELKEVRSYALSQQGCSGYLHALELANDILCSSEKDYVLVLTADAFTTSYKREVIYNVISDAASATLVRKDCAKKSIKFIRHLSNDALWDSKKMEDQILASYFPMATRALQEAIQEVRANGVEIDWLIPHNVSIKSWNMLAELVPFPKDKIWLDNIARVGHTVSADQVINLTDMEKGNIIKPGQKLLFFTFGFGAKWSSMLMEY